MRRLIIATCGIAAAPFACLSLSAEPITSDWLDQVTPFAEAKQPETSKQNDPAAAEAKNADPAEAAKVDPEDLVSTGPRKKQNDDRKFANIRKTSSENQDDAAEDVPEIPWELIELALREQNQVSSPHREAEVTISRDHHQLIIDSLPDFALDIAYSQPTNNIPILDFLREQTSALSVEIATFTSDIAIQDDSIAMASNGNLDSDETVGETRPHKEGTKLPSLLKKLFFWGLGLLVLYTVVEALFTKLLRRDFQGPPNADRRDGGRGGGFTRRRGFGRSRRRHRSA